MEQTVSQYLQSLGIPISTTYCEKLIASHPDYPSLLSIADSLQRLGINHRIARIGREHLDHLPLPCLIHPEGENGNGELGFIKEQDDLSAVVDAEVSSAVVLQAEPTDRIADPEHEKHRSIETVQQVMAGILLAAMIDQCAERNIHKRNWPFDDK